MVAKVDLTPRYTISDLLVLDNLLADPNPGHPDSKSASKNIDSDGSLSPCQDEATIKALRSLNDPQDRNFEPTVFVSWDLREIELPSSIDRWVLQPYIQWAQGVARNPTDVSMITHLILHFITIVPSAIFLFYRFHIVHGVLHWLLQLYQVGTFTLMMHQHIHMRGILSPKWSWFDQAFPYILDPLMGHTWNSYYHHHVKHHHVENNGPDDLSSTLRYQRDDVYDFCCYVTRFFFFIWLDLPVYFVSKGKINMAVRAGLSEICNYAMIFLLAKYISFSATLFVFILPLLLSRIGLMVGNWGQHAFVDADDPLSDFRSSITLIDVSSNRFCYNDGYHTSHHLNPQRHWREHPTALIRQKHRYANERALIFRDIDFLMITVRLLRKEYMHLAKCLVPIGPQTDMTLEEIAAMLQDKTTRFSEEQISQKFPRPTRNAPLK